MSSSTEALLPPSAPSRVSQLAGSRGMRAVPALGIFLAVGALLGFASSHGWSAQVEPDAGTVLAEGHIDKVKVELYGMSGCPFTRAFIEGPLREVLLDVPELIDFHFHPFGNCFHITEECGGSGANYTFASYFKGYNMTVRECWDASCGKAAEHAAEDCFSGNMYCQHGAVDGLVTTAWACAKHLVDGRQEKFMPFVWCTADRFLQVTSEEAFKRTIETCSDRPLRSEDVLKCVRGDLGKELMRAEARATVAHPACPYVLVEGQTLKDTHCVQCGDGLINQVCNLWKQRGGKTHAVCEAVFGLV